MSKIQDKPDKIKNYRNIAKLYMELGKLNEAEAFEYLIDKKFKNDQTNNSNSD